MTDPNETEANRVSRRKTLKGIGAGTVALTGLTSPVVADSESGIGTESKTPTEEWPQFQNDTANAGYTPSRGINQNPTERWNIRTHSLYGFFGASPVVADGMVYCGNWNGTLYACDEETGSVEWTHSTIDGDRIERTAAVANGSVYYSDAAGNVYAVDANTGNQQWHFASGGQQASVPTVANGTLYVGAGQSLYAVDAGTGNTEWEFKTDDKVPHAPAVADGKVFFAQRRRAGTKFAVDAETGDEIWRSDYGRSINSPTVSDGLMFISGGHDMMAFDTETGENVWRIVFNTGIRASVAVENGVLYANNHENLQALDAKTGDRIWKTDEKKYDGSDAAPAVTDNIVYVGIHAFDAETGEHLYRFPKGEGASPAVANGTVYIGDQNQLMAFKTDQFPPGLDIDIKPESDDNKINPDQHGVIPVAVLQTDEFNPTSEEVRYRFGAPDVVKDGGGARPEHDGHIEDVDGDGNDDLLLHFSASETGFDKDDHWGRVEWERTDAGKRGRSGVDIVSTGRWEEWTQFQYDSANTGYLPDRKGPRDNASIKWGYHTESIFQSPPMVANGMVYAQNWALKTYAWDAETGELQWVFPAGRSDEPLAVWNDTVYTSTNGRGDRQGKLYALNGKNGEVRWKNEDHGFGSGITVADGTLYLGSNETVAIDAETGKELWTYDRRTNLTPAVKDGVVYGGIDAHPNYKLFALDAETGEEIWFKDVLRAFTAPTVVDGIVYVGGGQGYYSYDAETGEKAFEGRRLYFDGDDDDIDRVFASPVVVDDVLYGGSSESVFAIDAETGDVIWRHTDGEQNFAGTVASPVLANGTLYLGDIEGRLFAFNPETGEPRFIKRIGKPLLMGVAIANGNIFITTEADGRRSSSVFALEDPTQ